jgi:hypothetical protein
LFNAQKGQYIVATLPKPLSQEWSAQQRSLAQLRESAIVRHKLTQQNPHRTPSMTHEQIFDLKELRKDLHLILLASPSPVDVPMQLAVVTLSTAIAIAIRPHPDLKLDSPQYKAALPRPVPILEDDNLADLGRIQGEIKQRLFDAPVEVAEYLTRSLEWIDKAISVANQQRDRFNWALQSVADQRSDKLS